MFDIRKVQEQAIYKAVKAQSDTKTAEKIVFGNDGMARNEDNSNWVKATMYRLENRFDREITKKIRMSCQCAYGMDDKLALLKELMSTASSMEDFASQDKAKVAGLSCVAGELYLQFSVCSCPMLAYVDKLETKTWCQCTTGYSKVLFEKAFDCEVDVELLKSIKMGDDICLMKIVPHDLIWK